MPSNLAQYEIKVRSTVAAYVDIASWPIEIVDQGLRMALQDFSQKYPAVESEFTVIAAGREQNLSTITDLAEIQSVAWPWTLNASFNLLMVNWRRIGAATIYIEDGAPVIGDKIRLRHTKQYRIQNLDGAATTTVPDSAEQILTIGAAAYSVILRRRAISENPAIPKDTQEILKTLSTDWLKQFTDQLTNQPLGAQPHWSTVGL